MVLSLHHKLILGFELNLQVVVCLVPQADVFIAPIHFII